MIENGYRCTWCGAEFDEPDVVKSRENMDGENGWQTWSIPVCPLCGSYEIEDIAEDDDEVI